MSDASFSIVIPYHTHEKTIDFLKRQLNYYHHSPTLMTVIIALSGDESLISEIKWFIKKMGDDRFVFFSTNERNITNVVAYVEKILSALRMVVTPYVVINGADDVLIPEKVEKGSNLLKNSPAIAATKGRTLYFNNASGELFFSKDLSILDDCPIKRLKMAIKDRDSIFYIIRRAKDLLMDYENVANLARKSAIVGNSLYHVEHLKALSVTALGKVYVFNEPWRLQTNHENNHTSHTPASFLRIKLGILDKKNYLEFKSATQNMRDLGYYEYKLLWIIHQIRGISITFKQAAYQFINKNCGFFCFGRILIYIFLNKSYVFIQKFLPKRFFAEKLELYGNSKDFVELEHYGKLKEFYFSEADLKLIEPTNL